ncbi:hypothetical protein JCM33374_g419 [Metschnikowia sp. JCM 33374]|nr:hypothetical protein JCM33374_g419 [Metschnikowia sp. JCM 33374]
MPPSHSAAQAESTLPGGVEDYVEVTGVEKVGADNEKKETIGRKTDEQGKLGGEHEKKETIGRKTDEQGKLGGDRDEQGKVEVKVPEQEEEVEQVKEQEDEASYTNETASETSDTSENSTDENEEVHEPVQYRGHLVRPLSFFGYFEIKPEVCDLKWISDHTSGEVHPDMATISMLYNQNLTLPESAQKFIAQSPELLDEARWEKLKAVFYGFYPKRLQDQAFQYLSKATSLYARRLIAKKTSRFENEAILEPLPGKSCSYHNVRELNQEISKMILTARTRVSQEQDALFRSEMRLRDEHCFDHGDRKYTLNDIKYHSRKWTQSIKWHQEIAARLIEAELFVFQLENAEARYDTRTQYIHVKTKPVYPGNYYTDELFSQVSRLFASEDGVLKGTSREIKAEINSQFQRFEYWLQKYGTGLFRDCDAMSNNDLFHRFQFTVPYESVSPEMCSAILDLELKYRSYSWIIVSQPEIVGYEKEYHVIRVYFNIKNLPKNSTFEPGAQLSRCEYSGFCYNCFGRDHTASYCTFSKFGFGYS